MRKPQRPKPTSRAWAAPLLPGQSEPRSVPRVHTLDHSAIQQALRGSWWGVSRSFHEQERAHGRRELGTIDYMRGGARGGSFARGPRRAVKTLSKEHKELCELLKRTILQTEKEQVGRE